MHSEQVLVLLASADFFGFVLLFPAKARLRFSRFLHFLLSCPVYGEGLGNPVSSPQAGLFSVSFVWVIGLF